VVLKIIGFPSGELCGCADQYVRQFDPDAHDGRGDLITTRDKSKALKFPSMREAMALWKQQSKVQPLRGDGRPNRPLTAFTVEVEKG
jgi:hypothetical protein